MVKRWRYEVLDFLLVPILLGPTFGSLKKGVWNCSWNVHTNIFMMQNIHWSSCSFYQFFKFINGHLKHFYLTNEQVSDITNTNFFLGSIADNFLLQHLNKISMEGLQEFSLTVLLYLADTKIEPTQPNTTKSIGLSDSQDTFRIQIKVMTRLPFFVS